MALLVVRFGWGLMAVLLVAAMMTSAFSLSMMSSSEPQGSSGMSLIPDQGARSTMNPYYQIPKFSAYPKRVEDRRAGRGLPSYQGTSLPSYSAATAAGALPPANNSFSPSSSLALAQGSSLSESDMDPKKRFDPVPDQGRGATMNPRYQINKYSTYPPHMNR